MNMERYKTLEEIKKSLRDAFYYDCKGDKHHEKFRDEMWNEVLKYADIFDEQFSIDFDKKWKANIKPNDLFVPAFCMLDRKVYREKNSLLKMNFRINLKYFPEYLKSNLYENYGKLDFLTNIDSRAEIVFQIVNNFYYSLFKDCLDKDKKRGIKLEYLTLD